MDRRGIIIRYYILRCLEHFDKVPHQRLLLVLKDHGIRDYIVDWIEQWLTDKIVWLRLCGCTGTCYVDILRILIALAS